jgi:DNA modification methylase
MSERSARPIREIADLQLDPFNANRGTARGKHALSDSLKNLGAGRSILADRQGVVIAGNKTLEEARALGLPLRVIDTTGKELVVVLRTDLDLETDPEARQLAIADNRVAELNLEWDPEVLARTTASGVELAPYFTRRELEQLVGHGSRTGLTDDDVSARLPDTDIRLGDVFALGAHRLICGDATNAADVGCMLGSNQPTLMVTDPPYGVDYQPDWRMEAGRPGRHVVERIANDDRCDWGEAFAHFRGDVAYVWHAALHAGDVGAALRRCGFELRAQIIWTKPHFVLSRGDFHWQHEPAWYAVRKGRSSHWCGDRSQSTIWCAPNLNPFSGGHNAENPVTGHSTQKPVALFERAMLCNSAPDDAVFDPFLGSGTALIAAEKTGRRCFALDIDPRCVQASIKRWEAFTGRSAERKSVLAGD